MGGDVLRLERSGVALATRHKTLVVLHLWAQGLEEGDEHPPYALL